MNNIKFSTVLSFSILLLSIFLSSCGKKKQIKVDHEKWREDILKCGTYRKDNYKSIIKSSKDYIGIHEEDLTVQLGTPEKEGLEKRMKKSIRYQVSGYECDSFALVKKYLVFEFETLRRVRSIYIVAEDI